MKKFKFSLETVLKWKRTQQDAAMRAMGEAMRRKQEAFETLQTTRRQMGALLTAIRQARQNNVASWAQVAYMREVARQEGVCKSAEERLAHATALETKSREVYLAARRAVETVEKLKEKRKDSYQIAADRALELELEEIMLSRL